MAETRYGQVEIPGVPEDEPVFLIRARDVASVDAIRSYGEWAGDCGSPQAFLESVASTADAFAAWQAAHPDKVKVPD